MTFLSRVDEGFGVGFVAAGTEGAGGRALGVLRACVEGLVVVPVCCGGESVCVCTGFVGSGVGATVTTSVFAAFEEVLVFATESVFPCSVFEFDSAYTSNVGSALGSADGEGDGSAVTA